MRPKRTIVYVQHIKSLKTQIRNLKKERKIAGKNLSKFAPHYGLMTKYLERIFTPSEMEWIKHRYVEEKRKEHGTRY